MTTIQKEQVSFIRFYILYPLYCLGCKIRRLYRKVTKRWYCEGCGKHHSGRVIRYSPDGETDYCYRHMTNKTIRECVCIRVGEKVITHPMVLAIREEDTELWDPLRQAIQGQAHPQQIPFDLIPAPSEAQAREAAGVLRDYCHGRLQVEVCGSCEGCPVRFVCNDPPYAWPEQKKPKDGGTTDAEEGEKAQPQADNPGNAADSL